MTLDPRWIAMAEASLDEAGLPARLSKECAPKLGQILADAAEQFFEDDVPQMEADKEAAAYDAHIHRQIDEYREK